MLTVLAPCACALRVHRCALGVDTRYLGEMQGVADTIGVLVDDVILANMYYEISGVADTPLDLSKSCASS